MSSAAHTIVLFLIFHLISYRSIPVAIVGPNLKGLLCQMRQGPNPVGMFFETPGFQTLDCGGQFASAVTHNDSTIKTDNPDMAAILFWVPPPVDVGPVQMR